MEKEIVLNNEKYKIKYFGDGTATLKTYDQEAKMWIKMNFQKEFNHSSEDKIINTLSEDFIKNQA